MTMTLRQRAATVTLAAATLLGGGVAVALPAHAAASIYDPCKPYHTAYQQDHQRASDYYAQYKASTGAKREKAYQLYKDYTTKAQKDLQRYDDCRHG